MTDNATLSALIQFTRRHRYTATHRELVCPVCGGDITLEGGVLGCERGHSFLMLAELAVLEGGLDG
jgi:hypothetical protein